MHRGFITLHRKIVDWEWYSDVNVFRVFTHLILTANWESKKWKGVLVERGQKITSTQHIAEETGLTPQSVRTAIKKLKLTGELTSQSTNKYTIVTLTNYDLYQDKEKQLTNKTASEPTNEQQTNNKQLTTTKQLNNITIKTKKEISPADFEKSANENLPLPKKDTTKETITKEIKKDFSAEFECFWGKYPKKQDKKKTKIKLDSILSKGNVSFDAIMNGLENYINSKSVVNGYAMLATRWLNEERWEDEPDPITKQVLKKHITEQQEREERIRLETLQFLGYKA